MIDGFLRLPATGRALAGVVVLFSEPGVFGSALTILEGDMLPVGSARPSALVVNWTFPREPGLLGTLIRMRAVAALGEIGEVGGEGSTESGAGGSGGGIMEGKRFR